MSEAHAISVADVEPERWCDPVRGEMGFRNIFGGAATETDFTAGVTELEVDGWDTIDTSLPRSTTCSPVRRVTIDDEEHASAQARSCTSRQQ